MSLARTSTSAEPRSRVELRDPLPGLAAHVETLVARREETSTFRSTLDEVVAAVEQLQRDADGHHVALDDRVRAIGADLNHEATELDALTASLRQIVGAVGERLERRRALMEAADARRAEETRRRLATLDELAELLGQAHNLREAVVALQPVASSDVLDESTSRVDAIHAALAQHGHAADETIAEAAEEIVGVLREVAADIERVRAMLAERDVQWPAPVAFPSVETADFEPPLPEPRIQPSDSMVEVALALSDELEEIDLSLATATHPNAALPDGPCAYPWRPLTAAGHDADAAIRAVASIREQVEDLQQTALRRSARASTTELLGVITELETALDAKVKLSERMGHLAVFGAVRRTIVDDL